MTADDLSTLNPGPEPQKSGRDTADQDRTELLITGRDRTRPIGVMDLLREASRSVAYLELVFEDGPGAGTGFLIAPDLLLTNYHNVAKEASGEVRKITADFDREADFDGPHLVVKGNVPPVAGDQAHDWAVIRIEPPVTDRLPIALGSPWEDDQVYILQHPGGRDKRFADGPLLRQPAEDDRRFYLVDTQKGSSGSPVFNTRAQCIALHRGAALDRVPSPDGTETVLPNEGIRIERVMEGLDKAMIAFDRDAEAFVERLRARTRARAAQPAPDTEPAYNSGTAPLNYWPEVQDLWDLSQVRLRGPDGRTEADHGLRRARAAGVCAGGGARRVR